VQEKALKLCRVVQEGIKKKVPVDLYSGFRAISIDVVTDYAFDDCWNQLDRPDLGAWFSEFVKSTGAVLWVFQQVPLLQKILTALPPEISRKLNPDVAQMLDIRMVRPLSNLLRVGLDYLTQFPSRDPPALSGRSRRG
jgi:hypothetical protein